MASRRLDLEVIRCENDIFSVKEGGKRKKSPEFS